MASENDPFFAPPRYRNGEKLAYNPPWYYMGDPDNVFVALAYGAVSMAIIWTVESISHRILFSTGVSISLSEVAALLTFQSRSWARVAVWLSSAACSAFPRTFGRQSPPQTMNRLALTGVGLRVVVLLLDFCIIFVFIPRPIPIFEDQVGSTELGYLGKTTLLIERDTSRTIFRACALDRVQYTGFLPTALRKVCFHMRPPLFSVPRLDTLKKYPNYTEIYLFRFVPHEQILDIYSVREHVHFILSHSISHILGKKEQYNLPLPVDIVNKTLDSLLSRPDPGNPQVFYKICSVEPWKRSSTYQTALVCIPSREDVILFSNSISFTLFSMMSTHSVNATSVGTMPRQNRSEEKDVFFKVGSVSRPRLCIFPALIILACLLLLFLYVNFIYGEENLLLNLLKLSVTAAGSTFDGNPLLTEHRPLPLSIWTDFREEQLSRSNRWR